MSPSPLLEMGSTCFICCEMYKHIQKYKVGGKNSTHLILAACFWTILGIFLFLKGLYFLYLSGYILLSVLAVAAGYGKSFLILDRTAEKNVGRILELKDGTCLGAVFSFKTWGMVLAMAAIGTLIRKSGAPEPFIGFILAIIGFSLLFSSRFAWIAWHRKVN